MPQVTSRAASGSTECDAKLRQPVFLGLREDKYPRSVVIGNLIPLRALDANLPSSPENHQRLLGTICRNLAAGSIRDQAFRL